MNDERSWQDTATMSAFFGMTKTPEEEMKDYNEVPVEMLKLGKLYSGLVEFSVQDTPKFIKQVIVRIDDGLYRRFPGNQSEDRWKLYKHNSQSVHIRKDQL